MTSKHSRASRRRLRLSLVCTFTFGVLLVTGIYLLAKIPDYEGVATIAVALVVGIAPAFIAVIKDGLSAKTAAQWALAAGAGAVVAVGVWVLVFFGTRQDQLPAASYISAQGSGNLDVIINHDATFAVNVPSGYATLNLYLSVADAPGYNDNCVNGAQLQITPSFGATTGVTMSKSPGVIDSISIPAGVQSLLISAVFIPPAGFTHCHEDIQPEESSNFSR